MMRDSWRTRLEMQAAAASSAMSPIATEVGAAAGVMMFMAAP